MNLGTEETTVVLSGGGTSSVEAVAVSVSEVGVVSTIFGNGGALRRVEVSAATRMGAGFGNFIATGFGGGMAPVAAGPGFFGVADGRSSGSSRT